MTNYGNNYNQGYQQQPQGNGNGQEGRTFSGFDNHAKIQLIGRITKDPESKIVNNSKVATATIAINHRGGKDETDFWQIEVWGNEGQDSIHNFLVGHCPKGRKVFVEGIPVLRKGKKDEKGHSGTFPTVKINTLIGLDGPGEGNKQGGAPQGNYQQPTNYQAPTAPPTGNFAPQTNYQAPPVQPGYNQAPPAGAPQNNYQAPPAQPGYQPPGQPNYGAPGAPNGSFPANPPGGYGAPQGGFPQN